MSDVAEQTLLTTSRAGLRVAVLVPCYNEQEAIGKVVQDFRQALPEAIVYVYDNNSRDETRARAAAAGAVVRGETLQGKGFVVRRMFADVEADVYVLVDGDDTYHAPSAPLLVERLLAEQLDMVVGRRVTEIEQAYRPGHRLGNRVLTGVVAKVFGDRFKDILSGYRVFSRRFVKSFPALTKEFEIETELTVHALELDMPIAEVNTPYKDRPPGSASKLRTYRDGVRILTAILVLFKEERPLAFFGLAGLALALLSLGLGYPVLMEYLRTGLVPRFPTAILATGLMILAFLSFASGLILETVTRGRKELKRLAYLAVPGPR
jgi:glycosyltransferase involved in cell wall biosynthesis